MEFPSFSPNSFEQRSPRTSPFGSFSRFIRSLPPSDKAIAAVLGILVAISCIISFLALVRSFQVAVPAYGGTLKEGVVGSPRFVNPLLAISDSDRDLVELTYAGLMGHDATGKLIPVLAESYTVSDDGLTYIFTLRSNTIFSDGTGVTADDVVYTIQKAQDPGLKSPVYANWSNIRVDAADAHTVRFTLSKPYALFLEDTTLGILPKHIWSDVSDEEFAFSPYASMPVGAGPFVANSVTRDKQGVITNYSLKSFKEYSLGRPYLSSIQFTYFADSTSLATALKDGSITSAYGVASASAQSASYARVIGVFFNSKENAAFDDIEVRKALSLAIDRTTLTEQVLGGYAQAITGPLPEGYATTSSSTSPFDSRTGIEDAKAALTDAGYTYDEAANTWSKDGTALEVDLTTSNVPELKVVAAQIQKDWQMLGVPTEIQYSDPSELTQNVIRPRAYSALLFGEVVGTNPDLYAFWDSSERTDPGLNIANYQNTDVDALLQKAHTTSDSVQKAEALSEAAAKIAADYPAAFLYTPDFLYTIPSTIKGATLSSISAPSDRFYGISNWYRYTEHVWPIFVHSRTN